MDKTHKPTQDLEYICKTSHPILCRCYKTKPKGGNTDPTAADTPADRQSETLIALYHLDYLPRSKQREGFSPYIRTNLKPIALPFDAYCSDIDEACLVELGKQGATHFEASNENDGIWYAGAIF
jgi:hypothetical protein